MPDLQNICVALVAVPLLAIITLWPKIYTKIFRGGDPTYNPRSAPIKKPNNGPTTPLKGD